MLEFLAGTAAITLGYLLKGKKPIEEAAFAVRKRTR
jgi:hypothetical protein